MWRHDWSNFRLSRIIFTLFSIFNAFFFNTYSMSTATATTTTPARRPFIKRPDDKAMKAKVDALRAEIGKLDLTNNELNAQINKVQHSNETNTKRSELQKDLKVLVNKQSGLKNERNAVNDQIKAVDAQMKQRIAEIQAQTAKNNFKNVAEIDQRVNSLDALIGSGTLKLVDERRYVKEMSSLRKLRKDFGNIEKVQTLIDQDKAKIAELKKTLSGLQNKELNAQFDAKKKELDELNASREVVNKKRSALIEKRNAIRQQKDEKYDEIRKLRSDFDAQFQKFKSTLAEEKKKREEEEKATKAAEKAKKRKELADQQLAEAAIPAFTSELDSIHNLLHYFDPSYVKPAKKSSDDSAKELDSKANGTGRVIEMPAEAVIIKKSDDEFFSGSKGKKKGGKKTKAKGFSVEPEIIVALSDLSIPFPTKEDEVPSTINILKETLTALEAKQDEQTKINIERAKAKVAALEAEVDDDVSDDAEEE